MSTACCCAQFNVRCLMRYSYELPSEPTSRGRLGARANIITIILQEPELEHASSAVRGLLHSGAGMPFLFPSRAVPQNNPSRWLNASAFQTRS